MLLFVQDPKRGAKEAAVLEMRRHLEGVPSTLSESDRITLRNANYVTNSESNQALERCGMSCQVPVSPIMRPHRQIIKDGATTRNLDNNMPLSKSPYVSCKSTWELIKIPSVVLIILQAAPGALPFGFCATFMNDFLQEQRGMTKEVR